MDQAHRFPFCSAIPSPSRSDRTASEPRLERLYESAILELNPEQVQNAIMVARHAIFDRAEEIMTDPTGHERVALDAALRILQALEQIAAKQRVGCDGV